VRWMRIPWTVLVATMSSAQAQPDPTIGTGRPMPSLPDTVAVDSFSGDGRAQPAARSAARFAPTLVTLHGSAGRMYASATDPATGRRASRLVPGTPPPQIGAMDPVTTALAMFDAFARRDVDGWVGAMARDYHFDSDDPAFVAAHPGGFDRDDERAFATHLFRVGARGRDGAPMPWAVKLDAHADPRPARSRPTARS